MSGGCKLFISYNRMRKWVVLTIRFVDKLSAGIFRDQESAFGEALRPCLRRRVDSCINYRGSETSGRGKYTVIVVEVPLGFLA